MTSYQQCVWGCGAAVMWAQMVSGKRMPLELEASPTPYRRMVALDNGRGVAKVVTNQMLAEEPWNQEPMKWRNVTFHRSHLARCSVLKARRKAERLASVEMQEAA